MSAGWVAGTVRARALLERRAGAPTAARLARAASAREAAAALAGTAYQRFLPQDPGTAEVERAVEEAAVWNLRVLAGWLPQAGVGVLRVLTGDFEIRNIADRLRALAGETGPAPYLLGALATAWRTVATADSVAQVRRALAASAWGDPGTDDAADLVTDLRLCAACRLAELHPATRPWGAAEAALTVARQRFLVQRPLAARTQRRAATLLGEDAAQAEQWRAFADRLPAATAGWVLEGVGEPAQLWRAERRLRVRVEHDAEDLARASGFRMDAALGCAVLVLADAHAVRRAVACAAAGGRDPGGDDAEG